MTSLNVLCGWLPICKDFFDLIAFGRVQSCVRPVDAVELTAGLPLGTASIACRAADGFRGLGPSLLYGLFMS